MASPPRTFLLLPLALWMWLAMMFTHELGHVAAAVATGGNIVYVNLTPGRLSSTLVQPNPHPTVVLWSGLLAGWLIPLAIAAAARLSAPQVPPTLIQSILDCWASFCLLAGGLYLAIGGGERFTDTGQLIAAGWPLPLLVAVGAMVAIGGYLWSRRAWATMFIRLRESPASWRIFAAAWLLLAGWVSCQWLLAEGLSRTLASEPLV